MKKILFALAAVLSIIILSAPALAQVTDGLIGNWKFDGNGNNEVSGGASAVAVGNAQFKSSGGKDGGYLYVNTSSDWGKIPYSSTFDLANAFTIEFWFRQRANQGFEQALVYKGTPTNNYNFRIVRILWNEYNQGAVIAGSTAANTGYWHQPSNQNNMAHGQWHHVIYSRNLSEGAFYLDGVKIGFVNLTDWPNSRDYGGPTKTPANDIIIGDTAIDTDFDNLRIYNRALSYLEVTQNGGFSPPTTTTTYPVCSSISPSYCYTQSDCTGIGAANWCGSYCSTSTCPSNATNQTNATTTTASPPSPGTTSPPSQSTPTTQTGATSPSVSSNATTSTTVSLTTTSAPTTTTLQQITTTTSFVPERIVPSTCTDSDKGISIFSQGITSDESGVFEDKCLENNLTEYHCKDGAVLSYITTCGNGCSNGACMSDLAKLIQQLIDLIKSIFGLK